MRDHDTGSIFVLACVLLCVWGVIFVQAIPVRRGNQVSVQYPSTTDPTGARVAYPLITYIPVPAPAPSPSPTPATFPRIQAQSALLFDVSKGMPVFTHQASTVYPIGSITKLMTALVAMEYYGVDTEALITINSQDMATEYPSKILAAGDQLRVSEAVRILLISSDNSVANALARNAASSTDVFVGRMNIRAYSLGMINSRFTDPVGFSGNVSTAFDLGLLLRYFANHRQDLLRISSYPSLTMILNSGKVITVNNTNILADKIPGFIGGKTGFLEEVGGSLVTVFSLRNTTLATVVLVSPDRFGDTSQIIQWYLKQPPKEIE